MNAQPNSPEDPEDTARRSGTERRGIIDSIPATANQGMKLSAQPDDYDQRADLHSLNSMIGAPVEHPDLATVMKVSQAISSEIVLEKLIDALMRTALQQAGADRGAQCRTAIYLQPFGQDYESGQKPPR